MTYTALAAIAVVAAVVLDVAAFRTWLVRRRAFWVSFAIIVCFQLLSNALFTGLRIVRYDGDAIVGGSTPTAGPPPFVGDWRVAFAPVEDLAFGFSLVLVSLSLWVFWGRRGVQRSPQSGPPIWRR